MSDSERPHGLQPTRFLCPWDFPGKSTGVGCYCLLCREEESTPSRSQWPRGLETEAGKGPTETPSKETRHCMFLSKWTYCIVIFLNFVFCCLTIPTVCEHPAQVMTELRYTTQGTPSFRVHQSDEAVAPGTNFPSCSPL